MIGIAYLSRGLSFTIVIPNVQYVVAIDAAIVLDGLDTCGLCRFDQLNSVANTISKGTAASLHLNPLTWMNMMTMTVSAESLAVRCCESE